MRPWNGALCGMLVVALAVTAAGADPESVYAQQSNQIGLVVDFGNGTVATRCVEFNQSEVSGYDVLRQSGLRIVADEVSGMGVTICDIGGISGCSASSCFCRCQGMTCTYWTYYHLAGGSWQYSPLGASAHTVQHGDVEGWAWGGGDPSGGAQPPVVSFDQICSISRAPATAEAPPSPSDAGTPPPTLTTLASSSPAPPPSPSRAAATVSSSTPSPPVRLTPSPTPALEAIPSSLPTSMNGAATSSSPTMLPSASPLPSEPSSGSPAATTAQIAQALPTATSISATSAEESQGQATEQAEGQTASADDEDSQWPLLPISYVVFILIVTGLVGWLVYNLRFRGQRA